MDQREIFRQRLVDLRKKRGMTQAELAQKAAMPAAAISHFETGFRFPASETLIRLADALGVGLDYLLGGKNESSIPTKRYEVLFRNAQELSNDALDELAEISEILKKRNQKKQKGK